MGQNSTEVSYGFGQFGSAFVDTTATIIAPQGLVVVAIQALSNVSFSELTADTLNAQPAYGTSHAQRGTPEFFGSAVAAHNLGDCVIAGATKPTASTTVTHTANTAGPGSTSEIRTGMQLVSLTDTDSPRDGLLGKPVIIEEILSTTTFRVSENATVQVLSSQSLAGLALNIEYQYDNIVKLAVKMGSIEENPSDKLQARVQDNYWNFMANVILSFEPKEVKWITTH